MSSWSALDSMVPDWMTDCHVARDTYDLGKVRFPLVPLSSPSFLSTVATIATPPSSSRRLFQLLELQIHLEHLHRMDSSLVKPFVRTLDFHPPRLPPLESVLRQVRAKRACIWVTSSCLHPPPQVFFLLLPII
jgi:hypothetical protein